MPFNARIICACPVCSVQSQSGLPFHGHFTAGLSLLTTFRAAFIDITQHHELKHLCPEPPLDVWKHFAKTLFFLRESSIEVDQTQRVSWLADAACGHSAAAASTSQSSRFSVLLCRFPHQRRPQTWSMLLSRVARRFRYPKLLP